MIPELALQQNRRQMGLQACRPADQVVYEQPGNNRSHFIKNIIILV